MQGLYASPPKATGIGDAKYVLCDNNDYEFYLNLKNSSLRPGPHGSTTGNLGVIEYGYRKKGDPFIKYEAKNPYLIVNGPSTKILVSDYKQGISTFVKTYDFMTAKGELKAKTISPQKVDCIFYTSEVY